MNCFKLIINYINPWLRLGTEIRRPECLKFSLVRRDDQSSQFYDPNFIFSSEFGDKFNVSVSGFGVGY